MPRPRLRLIASSTGRQRAIAALALLVGVAVVVVLVLDTGGSSPSSSANAATTTSGAATVERQNLVETDTESGTLSYSNPQTVYDRLSGTITWLPSVGQVIKPGGTLFAVDGNPVLLMDGTTPAYRDLGPDDTAGADILELNRNLVRLGYNAAGITVDDEWQAGTTYGVDLLQEAMGETETGILSLGQVVFLPGDQLVSTVDGTLGATSGSSGTGDASLQDAPDKPEFVSLTSTTGSSTSPATTPTGTTTTGTTTTGAPATKKKGTSPSSGSSSPSGSTGAKTLSALTALLRAEAQQLKAEEEQLKADHGSSPSSSAKKPASSSDKPSSSSDKPSSSSGNPDSGAGAGSPILQTTSTKLVVTVDLAASSQSEATVGEHVTVEMPNNRTVGGRITAVSSVAQSSSSGNDDNGSNGNGNNGNGNSGSSSTIPVTITLSGHHTGVGLDQAAVSVNFVEQRANQVLSVPVTALLATGGGNYAVQEAAAPHHLIPVTTGLFAAGYVQISGSGIYPGLQVTDSQG